jgi:hypothetical protein
MHESSLMVKGIADLFETYEQNQDITADDINHFKKEACGPWGGVVRQNPNDFERDDIIHCIMAAEEAEYFLGTAAAFALKEKIKTPQDLQNVFDVYKEKGLTELQKITKLGVTQDDIIAAIQNFVAANKAKPVDEDAKYR